MKNSKKTINVTQTYLPPFEEYVSILKRAWNKKWITNNGELLVELELNLKKFINTQNLLYCSNGTIVLQMALKALGIKKEVITTPFSYVATTNAILWEGCTPVFTDIKKDTFCIDPDKIEAAITSNTEAILATHVYGFPCDVEKIESIAKKYKLKVIYDGAHAFGCKIGGRSLLNFGDITTCSFHATKIFHTVEGGCLIAKDNEVNNKLELYRSFGQKGDDYFSIGINGKNSEFHAAMGLAILPKFEDIIKGRKRVFLIYDQLLPLSIVRPTFKFDTFTYNFSYYPILLKNEQELLLIKQKLMDGNINTRRYFYPSLNLLPYLKEVKTSCPISEDVSLRILCLPLYPELEEIDIQYICEIIKLGIK